MQGFFRPVALIALAVALAGAVAAPARAQTEPRTGSCPQAASGTACYLWTGRVKFVGDGDTISVDVDGDGTRKPVHVRITGLQAMEEHYYTNRAKDRQGDCHANEAADRLQQLIKAAKYKVQLAAQDPEAHSGNRWRREVAVRVHGRWRDLGRIMIREGQALWLPNADEWAWNRAYSTLAEEAATQHVGLWDSEYCAPGPYANVRLWVNSDAESANEVDGEWVRIRNLDTLNPLPLDGWWVRDSGLRRYSFPPGTTIAPGAEITVWVKRGTNTPTDLYWGLRGPIFDNVRTDKATGDGAYLFDPDGDLRAWQQYPCRYQCSDPLKGAVSIDPHYRGSEYVNITNVSPAPIDLEGYRMVSPPHNYPFGPDSVLQPGETMRIDVRGDPATDVHDHKHWGLPYYVLGDGGDLVELQSMAYVRIGCYSWGTASCGSPAAARARAASR